MPLGTKVDLGPGHIVLDGDPASPEGAQTPNFRPVSIVAKRWPISATAEHLSEVPQVLLQSCPHFAVLISNLFSIGLEVLA